MDLEENPLFLETSFYNNPRFRIILTYIDIILIDNNTNP